MSTVPPTSDALNKEWSTQKMNFHLELCWEEVEKLVNITLFELTGKYLNNLETTVLRGSYEGKTYKEMTGIDYQTPTLQEAGAELWDKLSNALGERVKKTNFVQALKRYKESQAALNNNSIIHTPLKASQSEGTIILLEDLAAQIPLGGVLLDSPIYIERRNVDSLCKETIKEHGALIRIKAPQRMGKTLLLGKLLYHAKQQNYQTAKLDLQFVDNNILADLDTFMKWLCDEVLNNLDPQPDEEEYWKNLDKLNRNFTRFFQRYLLPNIESPLVLAIDSFEKLFKANIFSTFCSYLRGWHDYAKSGDKIGNIWKKLRVVLVYSTETYPDLDTNHSPFNAGVAIELPDFKHSEVEKLANLYKLDEQLGENGLSKLMDLVGGHPYFIQQAFANLESQQITLEQLLSLAPTEQGIYSNFLREQLWNLQHNEDLKSAYREVVKEKDSVRLDDTEVAFKLHSMGLVKFSGNNCIPSYELYRQYFSAKLG